MYPSAQEAVDGIEDCEEEDDDEKDDEDDEDGPITEDDAGVGFMG